MSETPDTPLRRPVQITVALVLLWIVFCVATLSIASAWSNLVAMAPRLMGPLLIGMFALIAVLNVGIGIGWNWSRIVYLVLVLFSFLKFVLSFSAVLEVSPVLAAVGVVQNILPLAAMYLVFLSPGRFWFRR